MILALNIYFETKSRVESIITQTTRDYWSKGRMNLQIQISSSFYESSFTSPFSSVSVLKIAIKKYVPTAFGTRAHWSLRSLVQPLIDASCYCLNIFENVFAKCMVLTRWYVRSAMTKLTCWVLKKYMNCRSWSIGRSLVLW